MPVRYNITVKKGVDFDAVKQRVEALGVHVDHGDRGIRFLTGTGRSGLAPRVRKLEGVSRAAMDRQAELARE